MIFPDGFVEVPRFLERVAQVDVGLGVARLNSQDLTIFFHRLVELTQVR